MSTKAIGPLHRHKGQNIHSSMTIFLEDTQNTCTVLSNRKTTVSLTKSPKSLPFSLTSASFSEQGFMSNYFFNIWQIIIAVCLREMVFWGYFCNINGASIETAHKTLQWRICVSSSSAWLTSWILVNMTYWSVVQAIYIRQFLFGILQS